MRRTELSKVHDAGGVVAGGGGQLQLADEIVRVYDGTVLSHAAQYRSEVPRKRGRRDGTGGLGQECAVACDPEVSLLENGLRRRDQIENEVETSRHFAIGPGCHTSAESVGIDGIGAGDCAALRWKERYGSVVVLIEKNLGKIANAIRSEAACRGNGPTRATASKQERKAAVQRGVTKCNILLCKHLPREHLGEIGAYELQASCIHDVEGKIMAGNVSNATARLVECAVELIEGSGREELLAG